MAKIFATFVVVCAIIAIGLLAIAWRPPIEAASVPAAASFDPKLVSRGADLASIGNCNTCHTVPGARAFAGGLGLPTPFGTIFSTNITPDAETGIGMWPEKAFLRALREGVDRDGRHLYPAFPYDHFTLLDDDDIGALYAYFMTREPVHAKAPANEIAFPFNIRLTIAGWKLLFFRPGPYKPDSTQSEAWNRGAYLVTGVAHCGACHTPRNKLGAEKREAFAGGEAEGWTAYALNPASPAPIPWDVKALRDYLRQGWHSDHGVARGPMAPVVTNLAALSPSDLDAITTYLAPVLGKPNENRERAAKELAARVRAGPGAGPASAETQTVGLSAAPTDQAAGAKIYQAACGSCHESGRPLPFGGINLSLSTGPSGPNASNVINVVLWGLPPAEGERNPVMPGFAGALNDRQMVDLLTYMRARFSDKAAWTAIENDLRDARTGRRPVMVYPAPGMDPAQAVVSQRDTP